MKMELEFEQMKNVARRRSLRARIARCMAGCCASVSEASSEVGLTYEGEDLHGSFDVGAGEALFVQQGE